MWVNGVADVRVKFGGFSVLVGAALGAVATPAAADVLEIGADGGVTVYNPMVFTGEMAAPVPAPVLAMPTDHDMLAPLLADSAERNGVAPALVEAVAYVESRFDPNAISRAGAVGPMQLMPQTARELAVDPADVAQNIDGGARYLRQMIDQFGGDVNLALAAYNAGPAAVRAHRGVPPYKETQAYVAAVLGYMANKASTQ
jgi:soluble lytic murein transglycosylase-like protein